MVALKRKLRLEDNLGGKAYMTATIRMDRSGKSRRQPDLTFARRWPWRMSVVLRKTTSGLR
jgi:hypothetical protein